MCERVPSPSLFCVNSPPVPTTVAPQFDTLVKLDDRWFYVVQLEDRKLVTYEHMYEMYVGEKFPYPNKREVHRAQARKMRERFNKARPWWERCCAPFYGGFREYNEELAGEEEALAAQGRSSKDLRKELSPESSQEGSFRKSSRKASG